MARTIREIELLDRTWQMLEQIGTALGHDDIEETVDTITVLGWQAVAITDIDHRRVHMFGGQKETKGPKCEACGVQQEGFSKQTSVDF